MGGGGGWERLAGGRRGRRARARTGSKGSEQLPEWPFAAFWIPREGDAVPRDRGPAEPAAVLRSPTLPLTVLPSQAFHFSFDFYVPVTVISENAQECLVTL